MEETDAQGAIEVEDDFAELAGLICLGLCARRRRRLFYMTSMWPNTAVSMLLGDEAAVMVAEELRYDLQVYNAMSALVGKGPVLEAQCRRSTFGSTLVRQLVAGHEASQWKPSAELTSLVKERWSGVISSIIIEEANNIQKNSRQSRGSMKFRRPERAYAAVLSSGLIQERSAFTPVVPRLPIPTGEPRLHELSAFGKRKDLTWLDKLGISSTTQAAPYWSPTAENVGLPGADGLLWRGAFRFGRPRDVEYAFMGAFSDYRNSFVFRRGSGHGHRAFEWHFPLTFFQDSCVVALACHLREVPGVPGKRFVSFPQSEGSTGCFGIFDWEGITAIRCRWRSPSWQGCHLPGATWGPGVRLIPIGEEEPLTHVAARDAWWSLCMADLRRIAGRLDIPIPAAGSLFDIVMAMVQGPLGINLEEASDIVAKRLAIGRAEPDEASDIIMHCDEAAQCLDQQDERLIKTEQRAIKQRASDFNSFEEDFKVAARKRAADNKKRAKDNRKRQKTGQVSIRIDKKALSMASQAQAKAYMPPGGFLWKARATSSWYSRVPPLSSHSRTTTKADALLWVIVRAWQDWCLLNGVDLKDAPIEGIEAAVQGLEADGT